MDRDSPVNSIAVFQNNTDPQKKFLARTYYVRVFFATESESNIKITRRTHFLLYLVQN